VAYIDRVTVDYDGVAELLHSPEFHDVIQQAAEQVAAHARARGLRLRNHEPVPIEVFDDPARTRVGVTVAIRHPAGAGMEARHGLLSRAAHAVGLEVIGFTELTDEEAIPSEPARTSGRGRARAGRATPSPRRTKRALRRRARRLLRDGLRARKRR
jgi:hypothetical protein